MKTILLAGAALALSVGVAAAQQGAPQSKAQHATGGAGIGRAMAGGPTSGSHNGTISNGSTNGAGKPRPAHSLPQVMGREAPLPGSGQHPGAPTQ